MYLFGKKRIKKIAIPNIAFALVGLVILVINYFKFGGDTENVTFYLAWIFIEVGIFLGILEQYLLGKLSKVVFYVFVGIIILTLLLILDIAS